VLLVGTLASASAEAGGLMRWWRQRRLSPQQREELFRARQQQEAFRRQLSQLKQLGKVASAQQRFMIRPGEKVFAGQAQAFIEGLGQERTRIENLAAAAKRAMQQDAILYDIALSYRGPEQQEMLGRHRQQRRQQQQLYREYQRLRRGYDPFYRRDRAGIVNPAPPVRFEGTPGIRWHHGTMRLSPETSPPVLPGPSSPIIFQ